MKKKDFNPAIQFSLSIVYILKNSMALKYSTMASCDEITGIAKVEEERFVTTSVLSVWYFFLHIFIVENICYMTTKKISRC